MSLNTALIPPPNRRDDLVKNDYDTGNIVKEVLDTFRDTKGQLAAFAPQLRGNTNLETCRKIFEFIKRNIQYRIDPSGVQWVRTPARLWHDKIGDCKSYSIFAASVLHNLGIPGCFRFVSYNKSTIPTHVYVVAYPGGKEIIIDAVIPGFNTENYYTHKIDYDMNSLYRLSGVAGIGAANVVDPEYAQGTAVYNPKPGDFQLPVMADGSTSDALIEAAILKQRLEIEAAMMNRISGIGSPAVSITQEAIAQLDARIKEAISGVDNPALGAKKGIFKKIFSTVKKVVLAPVKLAQKIVTAPLAIILNVKLPASAMAFLYIFIPDGACAKMPAVVCKKRDKQIKLMKAICRIVVMKESHFKGLIQNGIMKKTGKTPLAYLSEKFNMAIGAADSEKIGVWGAIVGVVLSLVKAVVGLFKKKDKDLDLDEKGVREMVPDDTDFGAFYKGMNNAINPAGNQNAIEALQQIDLPPSTIERVLNAAQAGIEAITQTQQAFSQANQMQSVPPVYTDYSQYSTDASEYAYDATGQQQVRTQQGEFTQPAMMTTTGGGMDTKTIALIAAGLIGVMLIAKK